MLFTGISPGDAREIQSAWLVDDYMFSTCMQGSYVTINLEHMDQDWRLIEMRQTNWFIFVLHLIQ